MKKEILCSLCFLLCTLLLKRFFEFCSNDKHDPLRWFRRGDYRVVWKVFAILHDKTLWWQNRKIKSEMWLLWARSSQRLLWGASKKERRATSFYHRLAVTNLRRGIYDAHKVDNPLSTRFFRYAWSKSWTLYHMLKVTKSFTIGINQLLVNK